MQYLSPGSKHPLFIRVLTWESLSSVCENNKGTDQSVHPSSLSSAFVIPLLGSMTSILATSEI